MVSTLDLDEIVKHAESVYEACIIIAKRARQINEEQKRLVEREMEITPMDTEEDYEEEDVDKAALERRYVKLPKPTKQALQEFLQGKLRYEYEDEEEGDGKKKKKS